jgi:hypothetical protein
MPSTDIHVGAGAVVVLEAGPAVRGNDGNEADVNAS